MKSCPSPLMKAMRTGPSGPSSSPMPASLSGGSDGAAGGASATAGRTGGSGAGGAACAAARYANRLRVGRRGEADGRSRSCSRAISSSSAAPRASIGVFIVGGSGGSGRFDVAAPASHAMSAPPMTAIAAVRLKLMIDSSADLDVCGDGSMCPFPVCYYSSCTLHRLVRESIRFLRSPSSPSSPPDTLRHGSPARRSPTSTDVR